MNTALLIILVLITGYIFSIGLDYYKNSTSAFFDDEEDLESSYNKELSKSLKILGFSTMPSEEELSNKYRSLAKKYHPDANKGNPAKFINITKAYKEIKKNLEEK